jgi:hypothetical protein
MHHFAHPETLRRTRSWLTLLGFQPHQIETHENGNPRITLNIPPPQWAEVSLLIGAVECADPQGLPSFWDQMRPHSVAAAENPGPGAGNPPYVRSTAIGWHPLD